MKRRPPVAWRSARLLPLVGTALAACTGAPAATIDDLAWIAGCWAIEGAEAGTGELWSAPAGGIMLGTNRAVRDGRAVAHEFLQIREVEGGSLEYVAAPEGQSETRFALVDLTAEEVTFENPSNDFPRRIIYRLEDTDRLVARIEGTSDGEAVGLDIPMERIDCPGD